MSDVLHQKVQAHEAQIAGVRADMSALKSELHSIKDGQGVIFAEMKQVTQTLAALNANKPAPTLEVMRTVFSMATSIAVLLAAIVSGIVYVSSNANNAQLTKLQHEVGVQAQSMSPGDAAVLKYQIGELKDEVRRIREVAPWAPQVKYAQK